MAQYDQSLLEAALVGLRTAATRIEAAIADFARGSAVPNNRKTLISSGETGTKKRHISAEGRRRIAEAQKKRWAAQKKAA